VLDEGAPGHIGREVSRLDVTRDNGNRRSQRTRLLEHVPDDLARQ